VQPRFPEFPAGVDTYTLYVPVVGIAAVLTVPDSWVLLGIFVETWMPFTTITEAETKWLPVTLS
jgi:hypothetical protein